MATLKPNPDAYELGDLYRSEGDNTLFELIDHRRYDEKKYFSAVEQLVNCEYSTWTLRSILPKVDDPDYMREFERDDSGRLIIKTGSDNPLDHIGYQEITSWSQLTRLESVKLHVMMIERNQFHHSYFWFENDKPEYIIDETNMRKVD